MEGPTVMLSAVGLLGLMATFGLLRWRTLRTNRKKEGLQRLDRAARSEFDWYGTYYSRN